MTKAGARTNGNPRPHRSALVVRWRVPGRAGIPSPSTNESGSGASTGLRTALAGGGLAAVLAVAHFLGDSMNSILSALLPTLQERFGLSATTLALLIGKIWFSSSLTQPLFGALADRVGRRVA